MSTKPGFDKAAKPVLKIRFSQAGDLQKIIDFYTDNQHHHVDMRDIDILRERVSNGHFIIAELPDGRFAFTSASYNLPQGDPTPTPWTEIGSTRSSNDVKFGLYVFTIAAQTIHEFMLHPPTDKILANVYNDNKPVINALNKRVGWTIFEPSQAIKNACKDTKDTSVDDTEKKRVWLAATSDRLPHAARVVRDFIEKASIADKKSGIVYHVDFSDFPLANTYRKELEELASGRFGKELEASSHTGLRQCRAFLKNHMNAKPRTIKPQQPK